MYSYPRCLSKRSNFYALSSNTAVQFAQKCRPRLFKTARRRLYFPNLSLAPLRSRMQFFITYVGCLRRKRGEIAWNDKSQPIPREFRRGELSCAFLLLILLLFLLLLVKHATPLSRRDVLPAPKELVLPRGGWLNPVQCVHLVKHRAGMQARVW